MLKKILYFLFLFLFLSGSNIAIVGFPIKYIVAVVLFFLVIPSEKKMATSKVWILYMAFILCFGISCLITGNLGLFINQLLKSYFPAFVGLIATVYIVKKDYNNLNYILLLILSLGFFNVLVNYSQFTFNTDWYEPIEAIFQFSQDEDFSENIGLKQTYRDVNDGTLQGIFGNGVLNGYYIGLCTVLSLVYVLKKKSIVYLVLTFIFISCSFICQQRSPLYSSLFVVSIIFLFWGFKRLTILHKVLVLGIITVLLIVLVPFLLEFSSVLGLRYSQVGLEGTGREDIYKNTFDYILNNPIMPNIYELMDIKGRAPHNLFLNAFIYGGVISFVCIMLILFYQFKDVISVIKKGCEERNVYFFVFAFAWIEYTINCLVHNRSLITGDFSIWLIWGVIASSNFYSVIKSKRT